MLGAGLTRGDDLGAPAVAVALTAALLLGLLHKKAADASALSLLGGILGFALFGFLLVPLRAALGLHQLSVISNAGFAFLLLYLGALFGARASLVFSQKKSIDTDSAALKVLDTSALIDGRIVELAELGFVPGPFSIPRFVLAEAQLIADSADPVKRARGRRGLDSAQRMQAVEGLEIAISNEDFQSELKVDDKLLAFASAHKATLVTTDFNLSKVAEVRGVKVLNVQRLSVALRPVVLAGDRLKVIVRKTGKEPGQGVGYLEDGTMIVVENGAALLEREVEAAVVSVLQTSAGKMVFAKLVSDADQRGEA